MLFKINNKINYMKDKVNNRMLLPIVELTCTLVAFIHVLLPHSTRRIKQFSLKKLS